MTASEVFQERFKDIFKIDGVEVYVDEILVYGNSKEERDDELKEVLMLAKKHNVN